MILDISNTRSRLGLAQKHIWNLIEKIVFEKKFKNDNFWRQFLQICLKHASEQILETSIQPPDENPEN